MKRYFILNLIFFFILQITVLKAQTESYDAEYLKLVKEYTLNPDGSYDFHYYKEIKLNTYFSFHRLFGETFIVYNPEYQELKINEAYTVMADGKKVVAPANAFNEVLPGFARDIPAYNHLREMVVTHTGTEVGAVIILDYTIKTKAGFLPFFFGSEDIEDIVPIKNLNIIVKVPVDATLQYRMHNFSEDPGLNGVRGGLYNNEQAGHNVYNWSFRNVPALSHSANQDPEQKVCLLFSTSKDMMFAYFALVNQDAFKAQPGAEISKRVEAAVKDKKTDLDKILALQEVVIDELKLADIPLIYSGYKVRTPATIWKSANATSLEKAILLADMLKLANINACPVATVTNGWYSADMGNPAVFDGFLVQVNPKETGRIYLSVTQKQSQNLIYDLQDKTMIQLDGAIEAMRTFKEKSNPNVLEMEAKLRLEDGKTVGGEFEVEMTGIVNPFYKLRKDSSYLKTMLAGDFPSSSIKTIEQGQLAELKSKYLLTNTPIPIANDFNGFIYIELPRFKTGFDAWNLVQFTGSGDTPVRLDFPIKEEYSYSLSLPSDYVLYTPPVDLNFKNDLGELKISISQSGSTVKVERSFELYKDVISSDKMNSFKEMIIVWEKVDYRKIVISKK
jgi:hypothetical protein